MSKALDKKLNPNKILDWTLAALTCKDHVKSYKTKEEACQTCPIVCPSHSRLGNYETLNPQTCKMFDKVVVPLLLAEVPVRTKDEEVYDHFVKTGTADI
jgi:hypothetical protein